MRRRTVVSLLSSAPAAWPLLARAQQRTQPVIGYLTASAVVPALLDEFRRGLSEQSYFEGRNVAIEFRSAEGKYDRLPAMAAELAARRVDVIVTVGGNVAAEAAKAVTNVVPIVFLAGGDPVANGLVHSFARPGANMTGVAQLTTANETKRLQLLQEILPSVSTIAYLQNPTLRRLASVDRDLEHAARNLGVKLVTIEASSEHDLLNAFATISNERVGALLIGADGYFFVQRDLIVALSLRHRVPTMFFFREFVLAGGLVSFGTNLSNAYRQLGTYAGKVLRGSKPSDLPVAQQTDKIELMINSTTAKALGLTLPPSVLARADEVIE